MAKATVVIEQLFEDLQDGNRNVYDRNSLISSTATQENLAKAKKASSKSRRKSHILTIESIDSLVFPRRQSNTTTTNTTPTTRHSKASITPSRTSSMSSKSKSFNQSTASILETSVELPTTYDVALALFGNKLSPLEHTEIQNYENIYYMGLAAKKIRGPKNASMAIYDDDDSFYKAVPHDQIAYRYEIVEKPALGKGTFAQVVRAYDHKEKRKVAIKIVRNERVYLRQSREELRILQVLRKQDASGTQHIVKFYEFFMFRNHMCITFELLGMNLYQVLKKNQYKGLGSAKILQITRGTLKCLELLYRSRIIHCDIKPENIMLRRNNDFSSIRVGDFGSSCYEQQQVYHYVQSRFYRAPEVMLGMRYGPAIDMWSLGCLLGELSSGYPIFMGRDENDQLSAIEEVLGQTPPVMMAKTRVKVKASLGRGGPGSKPFSSVVFGDDQFRDMVKQMLEWDPHIRPSPVEIREHPWLKGKSMTVTQSEISHRKSRIGSKLRRSLGNRDKSI